MSWGYVPKKLKRARRERQRRKKSKNFSCETCRYDWYCGKGISKCPNWVAPKKKNGGKDSKSIERKRRNVFKNIFK